MLRLAILAVTLALLSPAAGWAVPISELPCAEYQEPSRPAAYWTVMLQANVGRAGAPVLPGFERGMARTLSGHKAEGLELLWQAWTENRGSPDQAVASAAMGARLMHRVLRDCEGEHITPPAMPSGPGRAS
ncbi:hypothetical protein ACFQX4_20805 [Roseomonas sp. GCM10028921]